MAAKINFMNKKQLSLAIIKKFGKEISLKETPFIIFEIVNSFKNDFHTLIYKNPSDPISNEPGVPYPPTNPPPNPHPPSEPGTPDPPPAPNEHEPYANSKIDILINALFELNKTVKGLTKEIRTTKPK
jgi:hypothetical protein